MIITWSRLYSSSYAQLCEIRQKLALGRIHCIHTKSFSFFQGNKLSLLALCFAHKLTLKLKSTSREERCVAPNDVCVWMSLALSFIVGLGWFGFGKYGNHQNRPPPALIAPLERGGPGRRGCGSTLASPARHRLALVGFRLGLDFLHGGVSA
jgi:hypothetical protein